MRTRLPDALPEDAVGTRRRARLAVAGVLVAYFGWGAVYLAHNPWNGGIDEELHRKYIQVLVEEHRLPWLYKEGKRWVRYRDAHAMHPPAYHVLLTPVYAVTRGSEPVLRVALRVCSLLIGAAALVLVFGLARYAFRGRLAEATAVALFVALTPHYQLIATVVNNDIGSVLALVGLLYFGVVRYEDGVTWKRAAVLGLLAGLAGLTKGTTEVAALGAGIYLTYQGGRGDGKLQAVLRTSVFLLVALALVAPWHARNLRLYGSLSFMPNDGPIPILPVDQGILVCLMHDDFPPLLWLAVKGQINTLWSQKDWIPLSLRDTFYGTMTTAVLLGPVIALIAARKRREAFAGRAWAAFGASSAPLWLMALFIACFRHQGWVEGGRYLLCLLPGLACCLVGGLPLLEPRLERAKWAGVALVGCWWMWANIVCFRYLVDVLIPMYHGPAQAPGLPSPG